MKFQIKRLISQITIFISANLGVFGLKTGFCYPFFYCHACPASDAACPLRAIEKSVYKFSFKAKLFFYPILILGVVGTLSGRAVCGWACPLGLLQRLTGSVARKFKKYSFFQKLGKHKIERYLRYAKYFCLIGLVVATTYLVGFMFTDICPVGFLTGTIPILILNPGEFAPAFYFWTALVVFILFLLLIFLVERGWCRYFCPVGAILAPFNKISFFHVSVDQDRCIHCNRCSEVCPMGINIPNMHRDPECILCGKCVNVCPKNAINFKKME
ncbi:MAG: 4Fe-4S binding protein [Candidatus Thermoplasmatota archaeon]